MTRDRLEEKVQYVMAGSFLYGQAWQAGAEEADINEMGCELLMSAIDEYARSREEK